MRKRPDQPISRPIKQRLNESGYLNVLGVIIAIILLAVLFFLKVIFYMMILSLDQQMKLWRQVLKLDRVKNLNHNLMCKKT